MSTSPTLPRRRAQPPFTQPGAHSEPSQTHRSATEASQPAHSSHISSSDDEDKPDESEVCPIPNLSTLLLTHPGQELPLRWDQATLDFRHQIEEKLNSQPTAVHLSQLIAKHRIGGAYIRTFGPGHVRGMVNLSQDPNARGNLRPLDPEHITRLYDAFTTPGAKNDYPSPIYLAMKASTIAPECLERMKRCDPRDPGAEPPLLELHHTSVPRQRELEGWIHSQRRGGAWLSTEELKQMKEELDILRSQIPLALLLNGFHRIHALERIEKDLTVRQNELIHRIKCAQISIEELDQKREELEQDSLLASYRVEIYEAEDLPNELVNWLVRNDDLRPAKGMGVGERTWWTGERILMFMHQAEHEGYDTREQQLEWAFTTWAKEVAPNRFTSGPSSKSTAQTARSSNHLKAEWAGEDPISRLFTEPFTLEMVLDTRHAIQIYTSVVSHKLSVGMLHSSGALLACRFWLSTRILMNIFNVSGVDATEESEEFIESVPITPDGHLEAVRYWNHLHSRPQRIPAFLEYFTPEGMKVYDQLYESVWALDSKMRDMQWGKDIVSLAVRQVFEEFGHWFSLQPVPCAKLISQSFQIYARLPSHDPSSALPCFYPAGGLPTPGLLIRELKRALKYTSESAFPILEYLLDRYSPTWTIGSQPVGTAHNANGWYRRPRGLHQIAMAITMSQSQASIERRLHSAILLLSDHRLRFALEDIESEFDDILPELETRCNTTKSQTVKYDVLSDYPAQVLEDHGGAPGLFALLKDARMFLRTNASDEQFTPAIIAQLYSEHPFLHDLIDQNFWLEVEATQWLTGWNTPPSRRYRNLNSLVGWGMYCKRLQSIFDDIHERMYYVDQLLLVSQQVAEAQGRQPWWFKLIPYDPEDAPSPASSNEDHPSPPVLDEVSQVADAMEAAAPFGHDEETASGGDSDTYVPTIPPTRQPTPVDNTPVGNVMMDGDMSLDYAESFQPEPQQEDHHPIAAPLPYHSRSSSSKHGQSGVSPPPPIVDAPGEPSSQIQTLPPPVIAQSPQTHPTNSPAHHENEPPMSHPASAPASPLTLEGGLSPIIISTTGADDARISGTPLPEFKEFRIAPNADPGTSTQTSPQASDEAFRLSKLSGHPAHALTPASAAVQPQAEPKPASDNAETSSHLNRHYTHLPPHVFAPPAASEHTLEYIFEASVDPSFDLRQHSSHIIKYGNSHDLHRDIVAQRQALRESIFDFAQLCLKIPYGGTFAVTGLSSMVASLKDDFACHVAACFTTHLGLPLTEALVESMRICETDGLFEHGIVSVDLETGGLRVDFRCTFPKARQDQLVALSVIDIGTTRSNPDGWSFAGRNTLFVDSFTERHDAIAYGRYLHAPRGPGVSEKESAIRGRDSSRLLECKVAGRQTQPNFIPVITKFPRASHQHPGQSLTDALHRGGPTESLLEWNIEPQRIPSPSQLPPRKDSPYSTGYLLPESLRQSASSSSSSTPSRLRPAREAGIIWETAWVEAQTTDLDTFLARFHRDRPHPLQQ
ncbi:hypothetical protein FRC11_001570 [Ceratobasidium sp. 423]|nr:hypothetical protein FRC11_001570 [Ceratobasidium sp. 423]